MVETASAGGLNSFLKPYSVSFKGTHTKFKALFQKFRTRVLNMNTHYKKSNTSKLCYWFDYENFRCYCLEKLYEGPRSLCYILKECFSVVRWLIVMMLSKLYEYYRIKLFNAFQWLEGSLLEKKNYKPRQ